MTSEEVEIQYKEMQKLFSDMGLYENSILEAKLAVKQEFLPLAFYKIQIKVKLLESMIWAAFAQAFYKDDTFAKAKGFIESEMKTLVVLLDSIAAARTKHKEEDKQTH
jgi:hypothetical protein